MVVLATLGQGGSSPSPASAGSRASPRVPAVPPQHTLPQIYNVEAPASPQVSLPLHVDVDMVRVMEVFLAQLR